nr:TPA_asm: m12 iORF 2 RNA 1 [Murid betaherpesvirus 1]DBA07719.1 TPA_asm: m12 iORF 2 RNA 1 [Murid betaherpesvirus 1]
MLYYALCPQKKCAYPGSTC